MTATKIGMTGSEIVEVSGRMKEVKGWIDEGLSLGCFEKGRTKKGKVVSMIVVTTKISQKFLRERVFHLPHVDSLRTLFWLVALFWSATL